MLKMCTKEEIEKELAELTLSLILTTQCGEKYLLVGRERNSINLEIRIRKKETRKLMMW